jgi:hypothetical protein
MGASVDTRYYHSWTGLRILLDLDEDSPNGKEWEGCRDRTAV